ncbi:hypothetical protein [Candidatus Colwellia aromaticivorans]|uniref:hypothetical protein n=1 Tax=Candidatus Colwellia aromaticivorans TaxID=2267621 RepID=UPI001FE92B22|nr:hypothetical protein [Candidatus Colwellia aromaticivorans]
MFIIRIFFASFLVFLSLPSQANDIDPVHYAYSNYLGSGIYHTTGQDATLINLPFSLVLGKEGATTYSLRLPVSLGFFDFNFENIPDLDFPDSVGTLSLTPGIQLNYQYTENLVIESYLDLGYARNLTTNRNVLVHSGGISSLYSFTVNEFDSIWASRIYYAGYDGLNYDAADLYAAIQLGVDIGLPVKYQLFGYTYQPRIFATAFWYFTEVDFDVLINSTQSTPEQSKVSLSNSVEFGVTMKFDKTIGYSWAGFDTIGLSYRFSENINVVRILFSFPI